MSKEKVFTLTLLLCLATLTGNAEAQNPRSGSTPPKPKTPEEPIKPFERAYGMFAASIGMHTWGKARSDLFDDRADVESRDLGGFRIAGYYVLNKNLQVGGFLYYFAGDHDLEACIANICGEVDADVEDIGIGVSVMYGASFGNRIWLGGALDLGMAYLTWDEGRDEGDGVGLLLFPQFVFDFMAFKINRVKIALHASLGLLIIPYMGGEARFDNRKDDFDLWAIRLVMHLGIKVGI